MNQSSDNTSVDTYLWIQRVSVAELFVRCFYTFCILMVPSGLVLLLLRAISMIGGMLN